MDPIAHTLFGATLAETGLKRRSRLATATLVIGANLPDIDAVTTVLGRDTSLLLRRGMTHGVVAMVALPVALSGAMWLWNRVRPAPEPARSFHLPTIVGLSFLAVWSHPFLDWMNTYGVRLLMPFDGRWFYGDTLFIVDPWFWLMTAAAVVLARSRSRSAVAGWLILGLLGSLLILLFPGILMTVKVLWFLGVATIVALRHNAPGERVTRTVARFSFASLVLYVGIAFGLARFAERAVSAGTEGVLEAQSNPIPTLPHHHRVVLVFADRYEVVAPDGSPFVVPRREPDAVVRAALASPSIRGFTQWMRFPYWETEQQPDGGWLVTIRDLRYVDPGEEGRGIGLVTVRLDASLRPVPDER